MGLEVPFTRLPSNYRDYSVKLYLVSLSASTDQYWQEEQYGLGSSFHKIT
uniref:Uncharacterized protein n=1 Tax=Arundo donax TaxID=35708 RepID=A0A0A9GRY4_ARUDO